MLIFGFGLDGFELDLDDSRFLAYSDLYDKDEILFWSISLRLLLITTDLLISNFYFIGVCD